MDYEFDKRDILLCESIEYRKGAIEVRSDIHPGCINLETWLLCPETNLRKRTEGYWNLEGSVQANVELELDKAAAIKLIEKLQDAVSQLG